jgi:nicotinamidase-related amidase
MQSDALLLIDFQKGFDNPVWGSRNNPNAELKMASLLAKWRNEKLSVIHIQHCSTEKNSPLQLELSGNEFKDEARPIQGEKVFTKTVNSAFIGTNLETYLRENEIDSLVIAGLTTDHCVSTSARMAGNLGFTVTVASDATATFDREGEDGTQYFAETIHKIHLASLHGEFCTVLTSEEILSRFE